MHESQYVLVMCLCVVLFVYNLLIFVKVSLLIFCFPILSIFVFPFCARQFV